VGYLPYACISFCCLRVIPPSLLVLKYAEESKPFPWQTPALTHIPARIHDIIVYLVQIPSSFSSGELALIRRIIANSP
jgi:hypothetical protein